MKEPLVRFDQSLVPDQQSAETAKPCKRPLHNPTMSVPTELSTVLVARPLVCRTSRDDRFNSPLVQALAKRIAVVSPVSTSGANGYTGWFSPDGEEWVKLHSDFGIAVEPVTVPLTEGVALKSLNEESGELPITHTALLLPTPNPFNPQTELHFQLKDACDVDLSIHNIKGERAVRLASGVHSAGRHAVVWRGIDQSGRRLASGTYFVRFAAGPIVQTQRLVLVK